MKKSIFLAFLSLALASSSTLAASINSVLVATNQLIIPFIGVYATNKPVMLGNYSLSWRQAGPSSNIVATLPTNILAGTYNLVLKGASPVSVEIGSVTAAAALNARVNAEMARAQNAETDLTNALAAELARANAAETGLSTNLSAETLRALNAEADLANYINAVSNNIVANANERILETSNNIVAKQSKNFMAAYAFGEQMVQPNSAVNFSSFIGDWTTNGTSFSIPADGVYQFSFSLSPDSIQGGDATKIKLQSVDSQNTTTNMLALFKYTYPSANNTPTLSGQITLRCFQGERISLHNGGGVNIQLLLPDYTNAPTATLSIIQIQ